MRAHDVRVALGALALLAACTRGGGDAGRASPDTAAPASAAAAGAAEAGGVIHPPSRMARCGSAKGDSVTVAGTESLAVFLDLLADAAPTSEDSLNTARLPVDRVLAFVGDSGVVYVDSSGTAPPAKSNAVRRVARAAVRSQLAAKHGEVWEALANGALALAEPQRQSPPPFFCGDQGALTLFVGDASYRLIFTNERGALRLTSIAYEPSEGE